MNGFWSFIRSDDPPPDARNLSEYFQRKKKGKQINELIIFQQFLDSESHHKICFKYSINWCIL